MRALIRRGSESRLSGAVRLRSAVVAAILAAVVASVVGFASALALAPKPLTVYAAASTVPISSCALSAPAADTYADQGSSLSNFGTATTLQVRSGTTLLVVPANKRTFVRFDLSACSIPANARVVTAGLALSMSTAPSASRTYQVRRITESWGETTLTWSNQPGAAASATATVATGTTANVTLEWNVLTDVREFLDGTAANNGWLIADSVESDTGESVFRSREHTTASERPRLVVTYYP